MRRLALLLAAMSMAASSAAHAQQAAALPYATESDIAALVAKIQAEKPGQAVATTPMLVLAPYQANVEYRTGPGGAAIHETDVEFFHVIEGSGTLVTGGTMVAANRTGPHDISGTGIEGGTTRTVKAGDFFMIPEGTPHWFKAVDGKLVLMSIHLPRTPAP